MKSILSLIVLTSLAQVASADVICSAEWNSGEFKSHASVPSIQMGVLNVGFNDVKGTDRTVELQSLAGRFDITIHSKQVAELARANFYEGISAPTKMILSFKNSAGDNENLLIVCKNK